MKTIMGIAISVGLLAMVSGAAAAEKHGGHSSHEAPAKSDTGHTSHDKTEEGFKHEAVSEGIRAQFQVMTLASMKMKDPDGHTHHVMVTLYKGGSDAPFKKAAGKVKIIAPSKKETVAELKDYDGILAANFTADEPGKYGVIGLFKVEDKKPLYKFWYEK